MLWARITGVVLASFSVLANFMFIPYYPLWSFAVIALDLFVIWALLTPRRDYALRPRWARRSAAHCRKRSG